MCGLICPCPCTNIFKRISAINRVIATLPRSAKTIRDTPEEIQLKLDAKAPDAKHSVINSELKTLLFHVHQITA